MGETWCELGNEPKDDVGRGGCFFILGRSVWERLWRVQTGNQMNLILVFLVLLAGTGADHRMSKWSAKACETYLGMGKPRARRAIEELIASGLMMTSAASTPERPQYVLPDLFNETDPIFLPMRLVTGGGERSLLRTVRETGDPLLLRMLIDLYGLVEWGGLYAIPLSALCQSGEPTTITAEAESHRLWTVPAPDAACVTADGDWAAPHCDGARCDDLWSRLRTLEQIGALGFESWVFESGDFDAEPLFSMDGPTVTVRRLPHQPPPAAFGVATLRVLPDTPARRLADQRRVELVAEAAACG